MSDGAQNKAYDPKSVEQRHYERWEKAALLHEEPDPARPPYIVCMPPPNVTARAHIGHGSTYTPQDVLVRYHRMLGENADWLPGTDHAAIATEAVLIRQLAAEGKSRESLGREAYLQLAWEWSRQTGGTIDEQFRRLGFGPDWQRSRFTMDDTMSAAVNKVFVQLYREGLVYRGKRLINWDPKSKSTISDAEIDHEERDTYLWRVRYPFSKNSKDGIEIATTRPETILADVAIAVHPDDERYKALIGQTVLVPPLLERAIPIIADAVVDREFGTGAVKVTPAHDATDYEIGQRHKFEMPSVIDPQSIITGEDVAVGRFAGMDSSAARDAIANDIDALGLLIEKKPYTHKAAISERSGAIVEPMLSLQWFVSMKPLAGPALGAYHEGRIRFVPERYGRTYEQWLQNIRDWNISRQVWWGHQLPVWYTPGDDVIVAETEEEAQSIARERFGGAQLRRDSDTLDTWFSSGLWPFSILGWPEKTSELEHWYPSSVLVTGWEIIFLWVARMVMLGLKFMGEVPFPDVFIAPLVFDAQGRKMSKSLGNAIDPLDMVEKYGADAFRMGMMRQMRLEGQELRFQESRCEEARNFNNKIWNAKNFALSLHEGLPGALHLPASDTLSLADKWILTRLADTVIATSGALNGYDFGTVAETLWKFIWYELCDWYIEAAKIKTESRAAVLSFVLNHAMRLLHPLAPFITEEVWLSLPHDGLSIVTAAWPDEAEIPVDREAAAAFSSIQTYLETLREYKASLGMPARAKIEVRAPTNFPEDAAVLVEALGPCELARSLPARETAHFSEWFSCLEIAAPKDFLRERYAKDRTRLLAETERFRRKLEDEKFVGKAPAAVVDKEREKLNTAAAELSRVEAALKEIGE
ncbi:MAG: valine--tRNA ligase [Candidatus Eremiobacteraeota bacterium]|nr:valine--tRNA ligase [Candidatus Eremiobacteraeota bacterium]